MDETNRVYLSLLSSWVNLVYFDFRNTSLYYIIIGYLYGSIIMFLYSNFMLCCNLNLYVKHTNYLQIISNSLQVMNIGLIQPTFNTLTTKPMETTLQWHMPGKYHKWSPGDGNMGFNKCPPLFSSLTHWMMHHWFWWFAGPIWYTNWGLRSNFLKCGLFLHFNLAQVQFNKTLRKRTITPFYFKLLILWDKLVVAYQNPLIKVKISHFSLQKYRKKDLNEKKFWVFGSAVKLGFFLSIGHLSYIPHEEHLHSRKKGKDSDHFCFFPFIFCCINPFKTHQITFIQISGWKENSESYIQRRFKLHFQLCLNSGYGQLFLPLLRQKIKFFEKKCSSSGVMKEKHVLQ
ncbi:hypothetical protein VP01_318g1 [Puccinia sorghi]|uniref:Uncharacterized protein n=1 Tax=Puccinia sorghi TaxID=27349 RepID=A0A0L6UYJ4_9BASI|nr:hypothetical protein VP01_318g1 [Puccinia sorghi]